MNIVNTQNIKKKKWYQKLFNGDMFLALFLSEMFEEALEDFIAWGISSMVSKVLNVLFLVGLTQGTKLFIKRIAKTITYKEGHDKMAKIKKFFAKMKKVITENVVWSNKLTISGILSTGVMLLEGTEVINVISTLPELTVYGFNVMPYVVYLILGLLSVFGIGKQGFESVKTYLARVHAKEDVKAQKIAEKEYKKELVAKEKELKSKQDANIKAQAKALVDADRANNNN